MSLNAEEIKALRVGDRVAIQLTGLTACYLAEVTDTVGSRSHPGPWLTSKRVPGVTLKGEDFILTRRATYDDITHADEKDIIHIPGLSQKAT